MKKSPDTKKLSAAQQKEILNTLQARFENHMHRHSGHTWKALSEKLQENSEKLWSLNEMETTGGEPDVTGYDKIKKEYIFFDCAPESPKGRRSLCYDDEALEARKENKPGGSALGMAALMGIKILSEEEYRSLQELGEFDKKTSSWIETPSSIRKLGGAVFCDRRYNQVFVYHNGAESYYAGRAFRGSLRI